MSLRGWIIGRFAPPPNRLEPISGKVFVLGSGPGCRPPPGEAAAWKLASVNGSQVMAEPWGMTPALTIFGNTFVHVTPSNREARKVLQGRRTGQLLGIGERKKYFYFKRVLRELGYSAQSLSLLTPAFRDEITTSLIGRGAGDTGKASNGIFLALLALHLGADEVLMSGFSLTRHGHAYNDKGLPRQHIDADRNVLAEIARQGLPIRTNDPEFAAESGLPLVPAEPSRVVPLRRAQG